MLTLCCNETRGLCFGAWSGDDTTCHPIMHSVQGKSKHVPLGYSCFQTTQRPCGDNSYPTSHWLPVRRLICNLLYCEFLPKYPETFSNLGIFLVHFTRLWPGAILFLMHWKTIGKYSNDSCRLHRGVTWNQDYRGYLWREVKYIPAVPTVDFIRPK